MTHETDNDTAKEEFISRMNQSDMYFIQEEIPKNESNENAYVVCGDEEGAKKYCPTRWRAMQNWFDEAHMVSQEIKIPFIMLLLSFFSLSSCAVDVSFHSFTNQRCDTMRSVDTSAPWRSHVREFVPSLLYFLISPGIQFTGSQDDKHVPFQWCETHNT